MADQSAKASRKASPEQTTIIGVGVTVLLAGFGQAAWLDGKIERQGDRLDAKIEALDLKLSSGINALRDKVNDIDKRLYVVESHVLRVPSVAQADSPAPAS